MLPNSSSPSKVCSFEKCGRKVSALGLCNGHYIQSRKGSSLSPLARKSQTAGMSDRERFDFYTEKSTGCHTWTGAMTSTGYGETRVGGVRKRAHRASYEWEYGTIPDDLVIDHTCHNKVCVNPEHLRPVTIKQNIENLSGPTSRNKSGYRGVYFYTKGNCWHAQVRHNRKSYHVGYFDDVHEAGAAAEAKRLELFTHSDGR